jgi:hypothetical protein
MTRSTSEAGKPAALACVAAIPDVLSNEPV